MVTSQTEGTELRAACAQMSKFFAFRLRIPPTRACWPRHAQSRRRQARRKALQTRRLRGTRVQADSGGKGPLAQKYWHSVHSLALPQAPTAPRAVGSSKASQQRGGRGASHRRHFTPQCLRSGIGEMQGGKRATISSISSTSASTTPSLSSCSLCRCPCGGGAAHREQQWDQWDQPARRQGHSGAALLRSLVGRCLRRGGAPGYRGSAAAWPGSGCRRAWTRLRSCCPR